MLVIIKKGRFDDPSCVCMWTHWKWPPRWMMCVCISLDKNAPWSSHTIEGCSDSERDEITCSFTMMHMITLIVYLNDGSNGREKRERWATSAALCLGTNKTYSKFVFAFVCVRFFPAKCKWVLFIRCSPIHFSIFDAVIPFIRSKCLSTLIAFGFKICC